MKVLFFCCFLLPSLIFGQALKLETLVDSVRKSPSVSKSVKNIDPSKIKKFRINSILVKGTYYTTVASIRAAIFIEEGDVINHYTLNRISKSIKSLGKYADVSIDKKTKRNGVDLIINVIEYPLIGEIQIKGNSVIESVDIISKLNLKPGEIFNKNLLRDDIRIIDQLYVDGGYSQAKITYTSSPKKNGDPLLFEISEGVIDSITITGNKRTRDYVILREMRTKPGDVVKNETLREDIRRIFNLNYFQGVDPYFSESTTANHYNLDLNITERDSMAQFSFGGSYSARENLSFFTDLYWDNFLGTGQLIALRGNFGKATTYEFKYFNPWMWDERKSFTFKTWFRDGQVSAVNPLDSADGFRGERSNGVEIGIGLPHSYELRTSHFFKHEAVTLTESSKRYLLYTYTFGISYDSRDIRYQPLNGQYYTFYVEKGLDLHHRALEFTKFDLSFKNYFQTFENQTIATRVTYGKITSPRINEQDLFSREIYYLGGSNTLRGYEEWPPTFSGIQMMLGTVEYRFYINDMFQFVGFADAGYATDGKIESLKQFRVGKGVGVRIRTPLGPLRLDYGIDDKGDGRVHFNIGHSF